MPRRIAAVAARRYLEGIGLGGLLVPGDAAEFGLIDEKAVDLRNLHEIVRRRRPKIVVEFGCGFSSITLAHALHELGSKLPKPNRRPSFLTTVPMPCCWREANG